MTSNPTTRTTRRVRLIMAPLATAAALYLGTSFLASTPATAQPGGVVVSNVDLLPDGGSVDVRPDGGSDDTCTGVLGCPPGNDSPDGSDTLDFTSETDGRDGGDGGDGRDGGDGADNTDNADNADNADNGDGGSDGEIPRPRRIDTGAGGSAAGASAGPGMAVLAGSVLGLMAVAARSRLRTSTLSSGENR